MIYYILGILSMGLCVMFKEYMMFVMGYQWVNVDYYGQVSLVVKSVIVV